MDDELQAIRALKQGRLEGLEVLVRLHQARALRTAWLITGDRPSAEDVVQEAFLRAWRGIGRFDERRPFAPWFLRTVVRVAIKTARRNARLVTLEDDRPVRPAVQARPAGDEGPEAGVESAQARERVRAALLSLPPRQRAAIVQRYYLGMSEREMAAVLGSPAGTVKWLLNAARKRLRVLLGERSDE